MQARIRHYLSMYRPQFMRGVSVLASEASYDRKKFLKKLRPLPNFNNLVQSEPTDKQLDRQIRLVGWSVLLIILMISTVILAFLRLNYIQILIIVMMMVVFTPIIILRVVAWCLPKADRASR